MFHLNFLFTCGISQYDFTHWLLRHHVSTDDGSLFTMDFNASSCMLHRERIVKLSQHAIVKTDDGHHAIFKSTFGHFSCLGQANHLEGFGIQNKAQGVRIVDSDVEDDPTTSLRFIQSPALQVRGKMDSMKDTCKQGFSNRPVLDQLANFSMRGSVSQMVIRRHHHTCGMACFNHLLGLQNR